MGRLIDIEYITILEDGIEVFCVSGTLSAGMILSIIHAYMAIKHIQEFADYRKEIDRYDWKYSRVTYLQIPYTSSGEDIEGFLYDKPEGSGKRRLEMHRRNTDG